MTFPEPVWTAQRVTNDDAYFQRIRRAAEQGRDSLGLNWQTFSPAWDLGNQAVYGIRSLARQLSPDLPPLERPTPGLWTGAANTAYQAALEPIFDAGTTIAGNPGQVFNPDYGRPTRSLYHQG